MTDNTSQLPWQVLSWKSVLNYVPDATNNLRLRQRQSAVQEEIFKEVLLQHLPCEDFAGAKAQQEGSWLC